MIGRLGRLVIGICVAIVMLAGCSGSQPPIVAPGASFSNHGDAPLAHRVTHNYQVIYSFKGDSDGNGPSSLRVRNGTLYGTTAWGGGTGCKSVDFPDGCGTIFHVSTSGAESVMHRFEGPPNAEWPTSTVIKLGGAWYGLSYGGAYAYGSRDLGNGAAYMIDASGQEQVIYSFKNGRDGAMPVGDLVALNGTLYGTTGGGGIFGSRSIYGYGTVFKFDSIRQRKRTTQVHGV